MTGSSLCGEEFGTVEGTELSVFLDWISSFSGVSKVLVDTRFC